MAGYQTIEALRPILHRGPPATPVVDRLLFYKPRRRASPTLDQIKRLLRLRASGLSIGEIVAQTGFKTSTVYGHVKHVPPPEGGWSNGSRQSRFGEKQLAKADRMLRSGFTWDEVADDLGCSRSTVKRALGREKYPRTVDTPLSRVVRAVRNATGVPGPAIRQSDASGSKVPADVARARHIVFWIAHRRLGIQEIEIAKRLGGFNSKTVSRGCRAADRVADQLPIRDDMALGVIASMMWKAEWPKASA